MVKMLLHCGANEITLDDVANVVTPAATLSHHPIPHARFLEETRSCLAQYGYDITREQHALGGENGARYFGLLGIRHTMGDYELVAGVRNSHDRTFTAGIVAGTRVFVCDNLSFNGEIKLSRKHTRHIMRDLPHLMGRMVGRLGNFLNAQDRQIEDYKRHLLDDTRARALMVECVKRGAVPCTQLPAVLAEWERPQHPEFEDRTMWSWFNAVTECAKGWGVQQQVTRTQLLHTICDHEVAIAG